MPAEEQILDVVMTAIAGALSDLHTATIAKITKVSEKTIQCKPVINRVVNGESIELPVFSEVPPVFLGGGDSYMAFPVAKNDYCLLIFTERCFDRWWNGQDFQSPAELRMHDYSDGFAICGLKNLANLITIPSEIVINGNMCLGSPGASDALALASLVKNELDLVKIDLVAFKTVFDAHTHVTTATVSTGPPGVLQAPSSGVPVPHTPGAVKSTKIKAE